MPYEWLIWYIVALIVVYNSHPCQGSSPVNLVNVRAWMRGDKNSNLDERALTRAHVQWQNSRTEEVNSNPETGKGG